MQLTVKGKQLDVGDALRTHVSESLTAVTEKYFSNPIEANVVFSRDRHLFRADISVHIGRNILLQANAEADEPYASFDLAADKMGKRLRRYKRRLKDHHKDAPSADLLPAQAYVLEAGPEDWPEDKEEPAQPVIVAEMESMIETLTVSDAVMRLDLGDLPALMFRNVAHGGMNMVYRRPDGNVGWVDPRGNHQAGGD